MLAIMTIAGNVISVAQTADEIIAKHIEATGGLDAWKKVNSIKIEGILNIQGNDVTISFIQLHGKGMRQDITVQGMSGYQILTPTQGWTYLPFQGQSAVTPMNEEVVRRSQNQLDPRGSFVEYKEKGYSAELAGTENINGNECYKIILTFNSGVKETALIDSKTFYVVLVRTMQMINDEWQEMETGYSNFEKNPEGIIVPRMLALPHGNLVINKVEVNKPVDENIFKPDNK